MRIPQVFAMMRIPQVLAMLTPPILPRVSRIISQNVRRSLGKTGFEGQTRLHLACGSAVLEGWANIDLRSKGGVIGWDLADPLPVFSGAIEFIFCEHFIEHITLKQASLLFAECYRVMRPEGILRLSTPNLRKFIDEYLLGRVSEWCDVGFSPSTPCQMVNDGLRLWGHQFTYDFDELQRVLLESGYRKVTPVAWRESTSSALRNLEIRPFHGEVILEATK